MKKSLFSILGTLVLFFSLCGTGNALLFTDTVNFSGNSVNGHTGTLLYGVNNWASWNHDVTSDFSVPYDEVNSALLTIRGYGIGGNNDGVYAELVFQGTLSGDSESHYEWVWFWREEVVEWYYSSSQFDVSEVFETWAAGSSLDILLNYNDNVGGFLLTSSTFSLDYDNASAPVPEPATLMLIGSGLLGMAGLRRKMKK